MSKELKEIYGAERVLKIKTFLEMIVYTDELSKINLEYLMDNAEVLLYAIEQAERVQELEELVEGYKIELMIKDNAKKRAKQENKRYREALEDISKVGWSDRFGGGFSYTGENHAECVKIAKQALEGEE